VVNGLHAEGPLSGLGFWYARLNEGQRLTGIGASDNHDPAAGPDKAPIGRPSTVVYARELSQSGILDAIRAGNVFIDVEGSPDRLLEVSAVSGSSRATMGQGLPARQAVQVSARIRGLASGTARLMANAEQAQSKDFTAAQGDATVAFDIARGQACGWVSINVASPEGRLMLIGNPIYVDCAKR